MSEQQVDLRFKAEGVHQYASGIANRSFGVISSLDLTTNTFKEIGRTVRYLNFINMISE